MVTGEPIPVEKGVGDPVTAGTLNKTGGLVISAEKVGRETLLARIIDMVARAQRSRAPIQGLADRVAAWFVPTVVVVAVIAFLVWLIFGPTPTLAYALVAAVSVLIIACPCALGLATPMSIMTATGRGAQAGILIKDAEALERLAEVDTLVVDKTGTLTRGKPDVTDITPLSSETADQLLALAAALERGSEHPLAEAIVTAALARDLDVPGSVDFAAIPGMGIAARVEGRAILLGNAALMATNGVSTAEAEVHTAALQADGKTVMYVAGEGQLLGLIAVSDTIKTSAAEAITDLRRSGMKIVMATGDNAATANAVADALAISEVFAELLPEDKKSLVEKLESEGCRVAVAGDGINDAPALAAATVGIAMGTGTDVAIESAGITLLKGDLNGIVRARKLASATLRNIRRNLFFAFAYNGLGIPIAAGVLYPMFGLLLSPMVAAAAMSLSSISVIANALTLRRLEL